MFDALYAALEARGPDPVIAHDYRGELCDVVAGLPAAVSARLAERAFARAGEDPSPTEPRVAGRGRA